LKTSLLKLKLKPDYDGAAAALERASVCYRNAGDVKKASKVLIEAAEHYEEHGNLFHAAKDLEGAAMLLKDAGDVSAAFPLFEKAIVQYAESGSLDTAAMTVERAAKVVAQNEPEKAIKLYEKGLVLVQQSDRSKLAGEFLSQIAHLNLRLERYSEASKAIREEIEKYVEVKESGRVGQLAIALVLVQLALGDSVAAAKHYQWVIEQSSEFEATDDARICRELIGCWESHDDDQFQNLLKDGVLRSMDNDVGHVLNNSCHYFNIRYHCCLQYLRLMKKLHAPEGSGEVDADASEGNDDDLK
uniref:Gamma-soluble NSF attachment protein n=1 Tax=Angiostrongylus costaricensis TaxID=334426 RepID=A0A0R3PJ77_ANGCS